MPTLPTYNSQANLTTQAPEAIRSGAEQPYEAVAKTLNVAQDVAVKWSNALDTIQYTTAKANYETGVAQLEAKALLDPDYNNSDAYFKELKTLKDTNLKGFQNKSVESKMAFEMEHVNQLAQLKIGSIFKKKQIEVGQVKALELIELEQGKYINSPDEQGKLDSATKIKGIIDTQVAGGIFGVKEGKTLYDATIKDAQDALKDRETLRRVKEKQLNLANEAAVNENEKNYIKMKVSGVDKLGEPVSREDLIGMVRRDMKSEAVSPEFADKYITALKSPKSLDAKTIDLDFANAISDINKGTKTPEKIIKSMLQDLSDGYLSERDFAAASTYLDILGKTNPDDLVGQNIRKSWLGIEIFTENTTGAAESRARMSRSFINKLQSGVDSTTAATEATREEVLYLHPEATKDPNGMTFIDAHGRTKIIMPNGDVLNTIPKKETKK